MEQQCGDRFSDVQSIMCVCISPGREDRRQRRQRAGHLKIVTDQHHRPRRCILSFCGAPRRCADDNSRVGFIGHRRREK